MATISSTIANTSYVNKDFQKIFPEILDLVKTLTTKWDPSISNESDPGVILLKLDAILADKLNYNIDKNVLECFPLSVTQERNARLLYDQLGYRMKWYKGATTSINLKWIGENSENYITIPKFTMVSDSDNSITYTLIGQDNLNLDSELNPLDMNLYCNGDTLICKAILGTAIVYSINNNTVVKSTDLDSNNRLYFNDVDIAENGIFISNVGLNNFTDWERKDNLLVENLGNTYFEFGVSLDTSTCYIEFPDDVDSLLKDGIEIIYIKTNGDSGNISAQVLEKFISDVTLQDNTGNIVTLNTDNTKIINYSAATNGYDPETLDAAYKNYKRTIGVFDTLITLRDYINYILRNNLASNGFISDRSSDPQSSYKIITLSDNVSQLTDTVDSSTSKINTYSADGQSLNCYDYNGLLVDVYVKNPELTAFDLKLYLFKYTSDFTGVSGYNESFELMTQSELALTLAYLEDTKSINHNFIDLLVPTSNRSHFCLFVNKYPLDLGIVTKSQITEAESILLFENIRKALYKNLNSQEIEFGELITVEQLSDIVVQSDERIKSVNIGNIDYTTYAIYWTGSLFVKQDISTNNLDRVVTEIKYYTTTPTGLASEYVYDPQKEGGYNTGNYVIYKGKRYVCLRDDTAGVWNPNRWRRDDITFNFIDEAEDKANGTPLETAALKIAQTSGYGNYYTFTGKWKLNTWVFTCDAFPNHEFSLSDLGISSIDDNSIVGETTRPACIFHGESQEGYITVRISLYKQFRDEIYTKSILAGKTLFYISDEKIDYKWSQAVLWKNYISPESSTSLIENVSKIKTDSAITFGHSSIETRLTEKRLRNNETLQLLSPNIGSGTSYSNYTKYEYRTNHNIAGNEDYQLQSNEYIIMYWKDEASDYDNYKYTVFGPGKMIKPSFSMPRSLDTLVGEELISYYVTNNFSLLMSYSDYPIDRIPGLNDRVAELTSKNHILSTGKSITERYLILVNINSTLPIYWITNTTDNMGNYVLEFDKNDEKILDTGEYFMYSNTSYTNLNILGAGTKLKINNSGRDTADPVLSYKIYPLDLDKVMEYGAAYIDGEGKWLTNHIEMSAIEYKFININPESYVRITPKTATNNWFITFNKDGYIARNEDGDFELNLSYFDISYKAKAEDDWNTIDYITLDDQNINAWDARSIMSLNISVDQDQIIYDGQSLILTTFASDEESSAENEIIIHGSNQTSYTEESWNYNPTRSYLPVCIHSTDPIIFDGAGYVNTTSLDINGDIVYNNIYLFSKQISLDDGTLRYTTTGNAVITLPAGDAISVPLKFNIPNGDYIIKFENSLSEVFKNTDVLKITYKHGNVSEDLLPIRSSSSNLSNKKLGYIHLVVDNEDHQNDQFILTIPKRPDTCIFTLHNPYKYVKPENISDNQFNLIESLIASFDSSNIYDFTYQVNVDNELVDPLSAYSFLNSNHIYNNNTICQLDAVNSSMKVFGKK